MQNRRIQPAMGFGSLVLFIAIAGCGGSSGVAEKSSPPVNASDASTSPAAAAPAPAVKTASLSSTADATPPASSSPPAAKPIAPPAAKPSAPAVPAELADARQLAKVLDLGKLPALEGATVGEQSPTRLRMAAPLSVTSAVEFYLGKLEALGWKRSGPATAESVTESFAQVSLGKDGYLLTLMAMPAKPKETSVTIEHVGNLDSRTLPRLDVAEDQYSSQASSLYFASAKVEEAAAALRRLLKADGWQEYDRAFSRKAERPDAADLLFRKKAYSLGVSISKPAAQPNKIAVQYAVTTLARDLPAPADAKRVEIEDSRWILMCEVPRDLAAAADYYRKAMPEIGFSSPPHETSSGKSKTLSFESEGHDLVLVSLQAADDRSTKVKLEGYSAAFRKAMKEAEVAAKAKREAQEEADAKAKAERVKAFEKASKQQDDIMNAAISDALKGATDSSKQTDLSKQIQSDVKSQLDKALQVPGEDSPEDPPRKKQ